MSKNMDPSMMAQAQQMMSNPAMAAQAQAAMQNMSADDLRARMNSVPTPAAPPKPAAPVSAVQKLKSSAMVVPDEVLEAVEEAEKLKAAGNASFKAQDFKKAISSYKQGATLLDPVLKEEQATGTDKQVT